jgi:N-acetylneuraminate lyase
MATGKSYMKLIGLDCGEFRLPVKNISEKEFGLFKKDVEELGFDEFKSA